MTAKLATPLLFLALIGCAAQPVRPQTGALPSAQPLERRALAVLPPARTTHPASTLEPTSTAPLRDASPLGLSLGPMDEEHQIAALNQAIALYAQFLERAHGRPELEPAIAKSRERIEDARATIVFLEAGLQAKRNSQRH